MIEDSSRSDLPTLVERSLVQLIGERAKALGYTHSRFAVEIWPELSPRAAIVRWAVIRNRSSRTGRPQGALIRDVFRMATVLGDDLGYLIALATEAARSATNAMNQERLDK